MADSGIVHDWHVLSANPNYYNYVHQLQFDRQQNAVILIDGMGQHISTNTCVAYKLDLTDGLSQGILTLGDTPNTWQTFKFVVEEGLFVIPVECAWNIPNPKNLLYQVHRQRIVFDKDPLIKYNCFRTGLAFQLEGDKDTKTRHIYYKNNGTTKTIAELILEKIEFAPDHIIVNSYNIDSMAELDYDVCPPPLFGDKCAFDQFTVFHSSETFKVLGYVRVNFGQITQVQLNNVPAEFLRNYFDGVAIK